MSAVGQILATILWLYWLVLIGRLIFDFITIFARNWQPRGPLLVLAEGIFTIPDPPIKAIRRFVPPLRLGSVSFDLAFLILLIGVQLLINVALML